jgi:hypothetical protein
MNRNFDLVAVKPTSMKDGLVLLVTPGVVDRPGNKAHMTAPPGWQ